MVGGVGRRRRFYEIADVQQVDTGAASARQVHVVRGQSDRATVEGLDSVGVAELSIAAASRAPLRDVRGALCSDVAGIMRAKASKTSVIPRCLDEEFMGPSPDRSVIATLQTGRGTRSIRSGKTSSPILFDFG